MNLFNKVVCFGDIHFGLRHNSVTHNQDCIDYLEWMIAESKLRNIDTCICLGDFSHNRNTINVYTLNFMMNAVRLLSQNFKTVYMIIGNHDMFWSDQRDINSMVVASEFDNVILVDNLMTIGDVSFIPWLVEDEWENVVSMKSKYVFGHLELPGFKMNAMVDMPDHGNLNPKHFQNQTHVFSGHFHKRQTKGKISYIGNPFGHNYSDAWDFDRGCMVMEWGQEPEFLNYEDGPRFINITLSSLLSNPDLYLKPKTHLQVSLDVDITYEEATFLRETFIEQYDVREFKLIKNQEESAASISSGSVLYKTVDQIVIEQLATIESDSYDANKLIELYNGL